MDPALKAALDALGMSQAAAVEAQQKAQAEFRAAHEADVKKRDALYDDKIEKLNTELNKFEPLSAALVAIDAKAKADADDRAKLQEQLDRIETAQNRIALPGADTEDQAKSKAYATAFFDVSRRGETRAGAERVNVLIVSDDTTGGYLAPPEYVADIIKGVIEFSPMRPLVTVRATGQKSIMFPKRTAVFAARWTGEIETRVETTGLTWGLEEIPVHEMTAESYISMANLEDSAFNLEQILREEFTEQFGVLEGSAMISGTGVKSIEGVLTATGYNAVNSGAATTVTADGIIELKYAIKTAYAANASFILNRGTLKTIRKLKDGNGQYLWVAGLANGRPNAIDGDSYTEMPDMPAQAASAKAMAYGDWRRAFILVDRVSLTVTRDPFTRANVGQVKYVARRRLGGQVVLADAYAVMSCST